MQLYAYPTDGMHLELFPVTQMSTPFQILTVHAFVAPTESRMGLGVAWLASILLVLLKELAADQ